MDKCIQTLTNHEKNIDIKTASPPSFSNIVIKSFHNSDINLDVLFNILPIIKISPDQIKEKKINYNGIFISVRRYPKARGYREPSKIKSFLDFDFYFLDKNFHVKVSSNAISVVGGGSMEKTKCLVETIYYHLITLEERWKTYKNLSPEKIKNTLSWMKKMIPEEFDPKTMDLDLSNFLDIIISREDENVDERIADIFPLIGVSLYKQKPVLKTLINCNSVYNYRLPEEISLLEKAQLLMSKGYDVIFHNCIIIKCFKATWVSEDGKLKFSFSIQNVGTVKQNSSGTHEESVKMYEKLVTDIGFIPYSVGLNYIQKKKMLPETLGKIVVTNTTKKILDKYLLI